MDINIAGKRQRALSGGGKGYHLSLSGQGTWRELPMQIAKGRAVQADGRAATKALGWEQAGLLKAPGRLHNVPDHMRGEWQGMKRR